MLELCDGKRTMEEIAETLAKEDAAPVGVIRAECAGSAPGLADSGYIKA